MAGPGGAQLVDTGADDDPGPFGMLARDRIRGSAPLPIGTSFVAELVQNREVLFSASHPARRDRVFLLFFREPEGVVGTFRFGADRVIHLPAQDDLGVLSGVRLSRNTSN